MTNIELYINQQLCDIQSPERLGIRLNRVLINPSELSTKDAQYSYSITIPSSPTNDAIFKYANVEEVKNKFNHNHTAQVYVDSVMVFDGRFKMSEIDADGSYKGNLVVPAKKTVKDIFGEKKMNEIGPSWELDFADANSTDGVLSLTEMLNKYNTMEGTPDCIFPLVLYGLLPKVPETITQEEGKDEVVIYSGKTLWDKYVRLGVEDFPPSINCLKTIQQIFGKDKKDDTVYNITGSAFDDERLSKLYMSYQNPTDYQQEWNWGHLGKMRIKGSWSNYRVEPVGNMTTYYTEQKYSKNEDGRILFATNLFNATGTKITTLEDNGTNIMHSENPLTKRGKTYTNSNTVITIPQSGLYKISLSADMKLCGDKEVYKNKAYGANPQVMSSYFGGADNWLKHRAHEIKLLRDYGSGEFDLEELALDGYYYEPNLKQNNKFETYSGADVANTNDFPKYYPVPGEKCVQFVDPVVNEKLLSGFRWGDYNGSNDKFPTTQFKKINGHYKLHEKDFLGRILAIKHGWSRDVTFSQKDKIFSAINNDQMLPKVDPQTGKLIYTDNEEELQSAGYWMYGLPDMDANADVDDEILGEGEKDWEFGWYPSKKFNVQVADSCFEGSKISLGNHIETTDGYSGNGRLHQVVWLNKGEHITLVAVSDAGVARKGKGKKGPYKWMRQDINFDLEIRPFKKQWDWITIGNTGTGTAKMTDGTSDFLKSHIDLVKFLPSEQKIDEWLDNFCKAFNLELTQPEENKFELNTKQTNMVAAAPSVLNIDHKASLLHRTNQPLGLPSEFQLGFKINEEEEGYVKSEELNNGDFKDGGGSLHTGNLDGAVVSQSSSFSYNWFKDGIVKDIVVGKDGEGKDIMGKLSLKLPVITHKEIWRSSDTKDYAEMQKKLYTNYAQRLWYRDEYKPLYNVGQVWKNPQITELKPEEQPEHPDLLLPQLTETVEDMNTMSLNYYDEPNTILTTYFNILATDDSNYTYIECYLTPDEYEQLDGTKLVQLNGDLYYIAALEGYDPTGLSKTKLKLMRRV